MLAVSLSWRFDQILFSHTRVSAQKFDDDGKHPAIALYDRTGLVLFERDDELFYYRIKIDQSDKVQFASSDAKPLGIKGKAPDCVMLSLTKAMCVFETTNDDDLMAGTLLFSGEDTINLDSTDQYAQGAKPSITSFAAFDGTERLVEVHEAEGDSLHVIYGVPASGKLSEKQAEKFDTGLGEFCII